MAEREPTGNKITPAKVIIAISMTAAVAATPLPDMQNVAKNIADLATPALPGMRNEN